MAGENDDIERLIAEMEALNAQADRALGGDDASGKAVEKRPAAEPVAQPKEKSSREGVSPALVRALVVSAGVTGVLWFVYVLTPFIGLGMWDLVAVFAAAMLASIVYSIRGRGSK